MELHRLRFSSPISPSCDDDEEENHPVQPQSTSSYITTPIVSSSMMSSRRAAQQSTSIPSPLIGRADGGSSRQSQPYSTTTSHISSSSSSGSTITVASNGNSSTQPSSAINASSTTTAISGSREYEGASKLTLLDKLKLRALARSNNKRASTQYNQVEDNDDLPMGPVELTSSSNITTTANEDDMALPSNHTITINTPSKTSSSSLLMEEIIDSSLSFSTPVSYSRNIFPNYSKVSNSTISTTASGSRRSNSTPPKCTSTLSTSRVEGSSNHTSSISDRSFRSSSDANNTTQPSTYNLQVNTGSTGTCLQSSPKSPSSPSTDTLSSISIFNKSFEAEDAILSSHETQSLKCIEVGIPEKQLTTNFVLIDQKDMGNTIDTLRINAENIEEDLRMIRSQFAKFQEKLNEKVVNIHKSLDLFCGSSDFAVDSEKSKWKFKRKEDFLVLLETFTRNERLEDLYNLLKVYRAGLKQNVFDYTDVYLRSCVEKSAKTFEHKLKFLQDLESTETEVSSFLNNIYENIELVIVEAEQRKNIDDHVKALEKNETTYNNCLKHYSETFGKETSCKVNKIRTLLDESHSLMELLTIVLSDLARESFFEVEIFKRKISSDQVRLVKTTQYLINIMQHAYETKKNIKDAIFKKDIEQVRHYVLRMAKELPSPGVENIFLKSSLRHAHIFLEQNSELPELETEMDDKEKRKREVIERIKNIIEKSDNFSAEKQNKFTQLLLKSGIRDATVLKELRLAWEEKKTKLNENRICKMLEKYIEEEQISSIETLLESKDCFEPITEELRVLKRKARILISRKKLHMEGSSEENISKQYDDHFIDDKACGNSSKFDNADTIEKSAHNFSTRLTKVIDTRNLSHLDLLEQEFVQYVDDHEVSLLWDKVCTLKEQQEKAIHQMNVIILSGNSDYKQIMNTLSQLREYLSREQYDNFLRRWRKHRVELFESEINIALQEDNEQEMLRLCVYFKSNKGTIFERNDTLSELVDSLHKRAGSISECRKELQEAIERREQKEIETAIIKARRFKSLREEIFQAENILNTISEEFNDLYMLERAMKSKNPLVLRRCLQNENTAHNSSDRLHTLRQQANTLLDELEHEYQLVEDLESLVQSKDMDKILDLREKCQHLRHISAEQVLNECDNLIRQCNESVLYVRNYISGTYCTKKELEDYLRSKTISKQDKMLLRQEWTRSTSKKMMDDLIHDSQLCNILSLQKTIDHTKDFLSDIGEEPHFENKDILLIKLQQAQELMTQLESLKNVLSTTEILNDQNLESIKKAIQKASEMNCLEEERTTAQNRVQLFMYARQILDNPRPVLKDVDNILQQAHSWQTLDGTTWKSLCSLKKRLTDEELLKQDIEKALHDKDIFSLQYCRERGKYSNLLEEYRKQIDLVLAQQKHAKEDLLALTKRFVELKHIDEKEYLKFKDVLPEKDINALKEMALKICQQNQEQEQLTNIMENEIKEQIQEHENQLQSLKTTLEEKQREKECILESSTSLDLEIQRLNQECESLKQKALEATLKRNHIEQLKLENIRLLQEQHDRIRDTEQQLTHQEDEILVNSKRIEDQVIKIREYEKEHENVQKQMTSLKDEFLSIQANLDIVIKQLQNEKSSMDILREELKHKELEVISQKNEKNTLMECVAQLQKTSNRLNEELSNLLLEKETLRNEEINTRKQLESIQAICAIQLQDIDMLKNEIRRLEKERTNMDLEKEALNLELKNCFESLSAIQNSMELQRHQLEDLREKTHARSTECMELEALIQQEQLALNDKQLSLQEHLKQREKLEELRNSEEQKLTEEIKLCETLHQEVLQLEQIRNEKEEQARVRQQEKYNLEQALKSNLEERFEEENVQINSLKEQCKKKEEERLFLEQLLRDEIQRIENQKILNEKTLKDLNNQAKINELQHSLALKEKEVSVLEERHAKLLEQLTNLQQLIQKEDEEFKNTQESISMQKESNQSVIQTLKKQLEEEENYLYEVTDLIQKKAQENSVLRNELTLLKEQHLDLETLHREQLAIKEEYQKLDILKRELAQKETEKNQIEVEMEYISQQRKQLESIKTKEMEELKQYQTQLSDKLIAEEMKVKQLEEMIKTKESQKELQTEELYKREMKLLFELENKYKEQEEKLKLLEIQEKMKLQDEEDRLIRIQEALKLKVAERENLDLELAQETNKTSQLLEQQQRDNAEKQDLLHNLSQTHRVLEEQHDHMTTSIKSLELALNQKQQERHDLEELLRKEQSTLEAERKQLTESEQQKSVHQEKLKALQQEHATLTSLIKKEETVLRVEKENLKRLQNDIQTLQRKQSQLEEEVKQRKSIMTSEATEQANGPLDSNSERVPNDSNVEVVTTNNVKITDESPQSSTEVTTAFKSPSMVSEEKSAPPEKKKAILPSKVNKKPTPAPIEIIDSLLTDLHKKGINDEFPQDDKKHYILPLNYDPLIVMVQQYACILCDKCIMGKGDLSRFYHMVFPKLLESLASHIKSEQHDMEAQQRYKKLFTKLRHVKKTFSEFEHVKTLEASKEYATLSLLFIFYAFIYGVFSKEFWDYYCSAVDFLKEHYESSSSLLMNADSREDLLFLVKKQSKFKCILSDFETVADHQKEVAELLLVDHHNCHQCLSMPPLERLKGVLYEIRQACFRNSSSGGDSMSGQNSQAISELLQLKFTASLLSTYEIGFRQFKFFGRYFFWDYLKFYLEKVATKQSSNETSTLIQELYQHANERLTLLVSKEPNDLKFALFVCMAINKRKLEEIFTPLFTNPQIAEYFSEDAIVRSDKVKDVLWVLAQIDSFTTLPTIDISQMNNMHFDYAKGAWIGMQ